MRHISLAVASALIVVLPSEGRCERAPLPIAPERVLEIAPDTTSWSNVDIAPDGETLAFDMLGDLYTMPASGGTARQITSGLALDTQPVFSPDGGRIAFVSDRSGSENLWIASADGTQARKVTQFDDDTALASPAWSADGATLYFSRHRPDLDNYELWQAKPGSAPTLLVDAKPGPDAARDTWRSTLGAAASPDGRYLWFARVKGGLTFDKPVPWTIWRRDLKSGEEREVIAGPGGRGSDEEAFFKPLPSPDGTRLAYVARRGNLAELRLRELRTGRDISLGPLSSDAVQASAWLGLAPRFAFAPDGAAIIVSHAGRFERRPVAGGDAVRLARTVNARVSVAPSTRFRVEEDNGPVRAHLAQGASISPDGAMVAFTAIGNLWIQSLAGNEARKIETGTTVLPAHPAWSSDSETLAFVSWSEAEGGAIWTVTANGGEPQRIAALPAYYRSPVFDYGGDHLLVLRSALDARRQSQFEFGALRPSQLIRIDMASGDTEILAEGAFGGRIERVGGAYHVLSSDGLVRIDADGTMTTVARAVGPNWYFAEGSATADMLSISPDGSRIAALIANRVYLVDAASFDSGAVNLVDPDGPARPVSGFLADEIAWSDHATLIATGGTLLHIIDVSAPAQRRTIRLDAAMARARPTGSLLLSGARVLTMAKGDRVIADADILITQDRIAAIGPRGSLPAPPGTEVRDMSGKTILPGFIDAHDHVGSIRREVHAPDSWSLRARLAYGVTTSFDPSTLSVDHLAYQDMVDAGIIVAPRLRSTGPAVFSKLRFSSLDDVREGLRLYSDGYRLDNAKQYRTGDRQVREWLAIAAREQRLLPTTEGALSLKLAMANILDGYAGHEHALPTDPFGDDLIALMTEMRTSYITTLSITNSGSPANDWFSARAGWQDDAKLRRFWPAAAIRHKLDRGHDWRPLSQLRFPSVALGAARLANAGGLVGMGSHGDIPGLGFHWEMEAHVLGGMEPMAVLHAATAGSAETIGRLTDLGTIEPGKLADLVVLDADPSTDIANTRAISAIMRGGFLYDGETLAPIWPEAGPPAHPARNPSAMEQWLPVDSAHGH